MRTLFSVSLAVLCSIVSSFAQPPQTVGLLKSDSLAYVGYTLIAPVASRKIYLIDNCGKRVHEWQSSRTPGFSTYLLEDGDLMRTIRMDLSEIHSGVGGGVERLAWDGTVKWRYVCSDSTISMHHDIKVMPNGNVLIIAAQRVPRATVIAAGRDSTKLLNDMWIDKIQEIRPIGADSGEVVWEWFAWDHIVQEVNPSLDNYGIVSEHPERLNINYYSDAQGSQYRNWNHVNSVDYDPELDQIMVSVRNFDEFWIIDHSTTTEEAKGSVGGRTGKGGDLLYRWGNPKAYNRGAREERQLFAQHRAHWIRRDESNRGKIILFNNGGARGTTPFSSVDIIEPPLQPDGTYLIAENEPFGPNQPHWTFQGEPNDEIFSAVMGGAQQLANGNTLISAGAQGRIVEVDKNGNVHWEYVNPISGIGQIIQGLPASDNMIFFSLRYSPTYSGLAGRELKPGAPLEGNPRPTDCVVKMPTTGVESDQTDIDDSNTIVSAFPNPFKEVLTLFAESAGTTFQLIDVTGRVVATGVLGELATSINVSILQSGVYFLTDRTGQCRRLVKVE